MALVNSSTGEPSHPSFGDVELECKTLVDEVSAFSTLHTATSPRFSIPTCFDNEFSYTDGSSQSPNDLQSIPHNSVSEPETEQSRAFSMRTVEDLGYGALNSQSQGQSLQDQRPDESENCHSLQKTRSPDTNVDNTSRETNGLLQHIGSEDVVSRPSRPINQTLSLNTKVETLGRIIRRRKQTSAHKDMEFLPISELDSIMNDKNIQHTQKIASPTTTSEELRRVSEEVLGGTRSTGRRRIFAILALIGKTSLIFHFIEAGIDDSHLPLKFLWDVGSFNVFRSGDNTHIPLFDSWSDYDCEGFRNNQASMLAPIFSPLEGKINKLDRHVILPFVEYHKTSEGGYGNVFRVKIHPSHHTFSPSEYFNDENPYFAVKTLWLPGRKELKHEIEALKLLSSAANPNPHLIRLLLAYEHDDTYHLLFHWANSNLRQYWERNKTPIRTLENASWFIDQCVGLTGGLKKIHRIHTTSWPSDGAQFPVNHRPGRNRGRHGDLKPENILCFKKDDKIQLVISDFGFSRYHTPESQSNEPYDQLPGWTGAYRPPECDMKQEISQRYDIWTLGCVFLIFVSWFVLDYDTGVEEFAEQRADEDIPVPPQIYKEDKFFNMVDGVPELKDSVKKWIKKIRTSSNRPSFVNGFLDLIEKGLLVPTSGMRWNCDKVHCELQQIQKEFHSDQEYSQGQDTDYSNSERRKAASWLMPKLPVEDTVCSSGTSEGDGRTIDTAITTPSMTRENTEACLKDEDYSEPPQELSADSHLTKPISESAGLHPKPNPTSIPRDTTGQPLKDNDPAIESSMNYDFAKDEKFERSNSLDPSHQVNINFDGVSDVLPRPNSVLDAIERVSQCFPYSDYTKKHSLNQAAEINLEESDASTKVGTSRRGWRKGARIFKLLACIS